MPNYGWYEPPDDFDDEAEDDFGYEPDPDEARDRHNDDPDLFDSRGRLWRDD